MRLLFICSRNHWRSPSAEKIYKNHPGVFTRSAGTKSSAMQQVNERMLLWADIIFYMEDIHQEIVRERYPHVLENKHQEILHIEDDYKFMDPELVAEIKAGVDPVLKRLAASNNA